MMKNIFILVLVPFLWAFAGCQNIYYDTMEAFGYHKRDLLVSSVQDARDAQQDAKEQFKSALEKFSEVVDFRGGKLEEKYKQLKTELEKSESKAKAVKKHISDVENVAKALLDEWKSELEQYTNENLRRASEQKLVQTQQRYSQLIGAMKRADSKVGPVLLVFRDQVLFLKHNLNAQAIASLHDELASVEADITSLIKEMEASIAEADAFIKAMAKE
jgi:septal ring factor EnvC (AmiA/AmiB activator)